MTIVTRVGVSYVDNMNDDMPEVYSFSHECYQLPPVNTNFHINKR